jgi:hypothetical protein
MHGFRIEDATELTAAYAAELADVTVGYLQECARAGDVPFLRDDGGWRRYLAGDILAWCRKREARRQEISAATSARHAARKAAGR